MTCRLCMILAGALCVAWCGSMCSSSAQDKEAKNGNRIQILLTQRRDTLRLRLDAVDTMYRGGKVGVERVISANEDLLESELELCSTKPERIDVCKTRLDNFRALENAVSEKHAAAIESTDNKLLATAARIEAEIAWLRLQDDSN